MNIRKILDTVKKPFGKGEKFEKYAPAVNAFDTFLFVPNHTTKHGAHIRDAVDLKRTMITVILRCYLLCFMVFIILVFNIILNFKLSIQILM